jgi:hypothetical protein
VRRWSPPAPTVADSVMPAPAGVPGLQFDEDGVRFIFRSAAAYERPLEEFTDEELRGFYARAIAVDGHFRFPLGDRTVICEARLADVASPDDSPRAARTVRSTCEWYAWFGGQRIRTGIAEKVDDLKGENRQRLRKRITELLWEQGLLEEL